jgi:glutamate carboxypeptidase
MSRFLDRLAELCAIDSPTGDVAANDACARLLALWAGQAGAEVELVPSTDGLHLVARTRGRGRGRVVLLGHHDTVFGRGTAARRPVHVVGGRALGPGVADMKGGLLVALAALELCAADSDGPHGLVELHSVPDEEGRNVEPHTLALLRGADACLCFECGRASGAIVTARKAGTWLTLTAHGRPAHAGTEPEQGRNALMALVREALRIEREVDGARPGVTAHVTWMRAGEVKNTIPDLAEAVVDVRAASDADLAFAFERVGAFGEHDGVRLVRSDDRGFPALARADALAERTLEILAALGQPALEETAGGVSDASWTSHLGVPSIDGLGPIGALDHTPDEYVEVDSIEPRIAATVQLLRELGAGELVP